MPQTEDHPDSPTLMGQAMDDEDVTEITTK